MSQLNVDNIKDRSGSTLGPTFPDGMRVAAGSTLNVYGDMVVEGTQTVINTDVLDVKDKTVGIASTSNPTALTQDGAGLEIYGPSNVTLTYSGQKGGIGINTGLNVTGFGTFGGAVSGTTGTFSGEGSIGTNLSVGSSIGAGGSVTATVFYGSAAGLTGQSGGLDVIDQWSVQGNDDVLGGDTYGTIWQQLKMRGAGTSNWECSYGWYFSPKDMSNRPANFPHAIGPGGQPGAGISVYSIEPDGYTSNTDCFSGKKQDIPAIAGIVTFPSTGLWQIDWKLSFQSLNQCQTKFGIECTSDIGAGTTVWNGLFPSPWNFCRVWDAKYCSTGQYCATLRGYNFKGSGSSNKQWQTNIKTLVSVADTNKTGIRYSWAKDTHCSAAYVNSATTWTYTKIGTVAPW